MVAAVRFMESGDLAAALECERLARAEVDPDFGTEFVPPWAWTKKNFLSFFKHADKPRVVVAEVLPEASEGRFREDEPVLLAGVMAYEIQEEGYHVSLLSVRPGCGVGKDLLKFALEKAAHNEKKTLSVEVPDGDWVTLRLLQSLGFTVHLVGDNRPGHWDVWYCEKPVRAAAKQKKK